MKIPAFILFSILLYFPEINFSSILTLAPFLNYLPTFSHRFAERTEQTLRKISLMS